MFGYIVANKDEMKESELLRYRACYCGLCGTLKKRYGSAGRMTLTYDMTFLILLLTSLYEPKCVEGNERCAVHPVKPHLFWLSKYTDYAADMNIALAYHNCLDDWQDDKNILSLGEAKLLKKKYKDIELKYPRQCGAILRGLRDLSRMEKAKRYDLDAAANCFGEMMAELFVVEEDIWSDSLKRLSAAMGRFIYMMDAFEDLEADTKRGRYNPLLTMREDPGFDEWCGDILKLFIGECAIEFEKLPLVQDVDIMRNILYSGVWTKYVMTVKNRNKRALSGDGAPERTLAEERN